MSEPVARTPRDLLDRVIDELNGLRNAGNRSPLFKLWRQNALTAIQRIWPNDSQHSDRFRRIPFSATTSRADGREVRECYERGCGEALSLLKTLRDEIGNRTFASVDAGQKRHSFEPGAVEDDFPTLDLSDNPVSYATSPIDPPKRGASDSDLSLEDEPYEVQGTVDPSISSVRDLTPRPARRAPEPARATPKLRVPIDAAAAQEQKPAAKPANASSAKSKPAKSAKKPTIKGRLKDMLGFTDPPADEAPVMTPRQPEPEALVEPAPEARRPEPARLDDEDRRQPEAATLREEISAFDSTIKQAKAHAQPKAGSTRRWQPGATRNERAAAAESMMEAQRQSPPEPAEPPAPTESPAVAERMQVEPAEPMRPAESTPDRPTRRAPLPPAEFLMPPAIESVEKMEPHIFREMPQRSAPRAEQALEPRHILPVAAEPDVPQDLVPEVQPEPSDGLHASEYDDTASLTADFLRNSPVLSSAPRPVPSKAPIAIETFESPTASALQALSAMVADIGVPEGHRARVRAALLDTARHLESREVTWDHLRDAVQVLMEFPPLARRALPLLLPYFDQAA